jgi:hypothetical protein
MLHTGHQCRLRVERWVTKLSEESSNTTFCKNRNDYAMVLLQAVETAEFEEPFCRVPSDAALGNLPPHLLLRVRSAVRPRVRPGAVSGTYRRSTSRVWNAAIASTSAGMAPPHDPEIYPTIRAPHVDEIMSKAIQHKQNADQWMKRHSGCFNTQTAGCAGLAGCTCHCSTASKHNRRFGTGTLASFPKRDARGTHPNRLNSRFSRSPVEGRPQSAVQVGPAWTDAETAWAAPFYSSEERAHADSAGENGTGSIFHEDIKHKPEERRSRRVSSLLRKLGRFTDSHEPGEHTQSVLASHTTRSDEHNALDVELHPKQAAVSVRECDVQKAIQRTEFAQAREEAVASKFAEAHSYRRLQSANNMNDRLQFLLSDMSNHVEQLRNRYSGSTMHPPLAAPAHSTVPEQAHGSLDAATMTDEFARLRRASPPASSVSRSAPNSQCYNIHLSGVSSNHHHTKASPFSSPPPAAVVTRLRGGDEIDREAARYGPAVAGRLLSPSQSQVSPISEYSTSKTEFPVFSLKDTLKSRGGAVAAPLVRKPVTHKLLEREGTNLAHVCKDFSGSYNQHVYASSRFAAPISGCGTESGMATEDYMSDTSGMTCDENQHLQQHTPVVLSTRSAHHPERGRTETVHMPPGRASAQVHLSTFDNPSWNVPIVPMVLPSCGEH